MSGIEYNESTKKLSYNEHSLSELSETDRSQMEQAVTLINQSMSDSVTHSEDFPTPPAAISKNVTISAAKLAGSGTKALSQKKFAEAHKLLSTALETVLRRPLWESTVQLFEEVANCSGPLCDANIGLKNYEEAYAQVSILLLIKPMDPLNHYRKGLILLSARRKNDAKEYFRTAATMIPNHKLFEAAVQYASN